MRQLLWKEMRELRAWVLAGAALAGILELLLVTRVFGENFVSTWMLALMPMAAATVAIGLGVGQVARERHARTLDFLLVRPIPAGAIVWSKFLAGTVALAVLLGAAVALCYAGPQFTAETGLRMIREQVGMSQLAATLFPRFWCLYALSLLFSVLVDRSLKAAALAGLLAITLIALASVFAELAPFSGFVFWLPFFESTGGLVEAARSWQLASVTGVVYAAGSVMAAAAAAALLQRSPERYLGNRGLVVAAAAVAMAAVASAHGAAVRLPEVAPAGSWQLPAEGDVAARGIVAGGRLIAVTTGDAVRFLDFREPSQPRLVAEVHLPLWRGLADWNEAKAAMAEGAVLLVGEKKSVPVDELEIAIVRPAEPPDAISLGPVRPDDYVSTPIPVGPVVYVAVTRDRVCSLRAFDLASHRELDSLTIDRMRPPQPGVVEGAVPVRIVRRGNYLYAASPSYLTAIDLSKPAAPRIASQAPVHPKVSFLYGFPRPLAWQDNRLFEIRIFPETLASYDLSDPAHPLPQAELIYHEGMTIEGAGSVLYRPWRDGVLEFRAGRDGLQALRYLRGGGPVAALVAADGFVYALTGAEWHKRRQVQAFRVR